MDDLAARRALADRQAIAELIHLYCRAVDRLDVPLGRSIFHADATVDYGDLYRGEGRGVIDLICAQHARALGHHHQLGNILIALDGDRAGSESYVTANVRLSGEGGAVRQVTVHGRYVDRWSRQEGRWGLDHRLAIRDFDEVREVTPAAVHDVGRRDRDDPSYAVLGTLLP